MADDTVHAMPTEAERNRLLLEVCWEIDKIARMLPDLVPLDDNQNYFAARAFSGRMLRLTHVMLGLANSEAYTGRDFQDWKDIVNVTGPTQG